MHAFIIALALQAPIGADAHFAIRGQGPSTTAPTTADEVAFERGLKDLGQLRKHERWRQYKDGLLALLHAHEGADYVLAKRTSIEDELKQAIFWSEHPQPTPQELAAGRIVKLDKATGRIELRYERGDGRKSKSSASSGRPRLGAAAEGLPITSPPFGDFEVDGPVMVHPCSFSGPYSVEFAGRLQRFGTALPRVLLVLDRDSYLQVLVGADIMVAKGQLRGAREVLLRGAPSTLKEGAPFRLGIELRADELAVLVDGRKVASAKVDVRPGGWFAFSDGREVDSLAIEGETRFEWTDALVDAATQESRRAFDKSWNPSKVLPPWMVAADKARPAPTREGLQIDPDSSFGRAWQEELRSGDLVRCLQLLDGEPARDLSPALRAKLRIEMLAALGRLEEALAEAVALAASRKDLAEPRVLVAALKLRLQDRAGAVAELRAALGELPREADLYQFLGTLLLHDGKLVDARRLLEQASASGVDPKRLEAWARNVNRAIKGPEWRAPRTIETSHYSVVSDLDKEVCAEVAGILEETFGWLEANMGKARVSKGSKLKAYIFAGREGYSTYCGDLLGDEQRWTAGLFAPSLQQLLLWSNTDRAEMLATVRHEGFHQWLDRVAAEVPVWLNEGLAQRMETLRLEDGKLVVGGLPEAERLTLRNARWPSLKRLFAMDHADFVADARLHYALSWAVLEHLASGDEAGRALYAHLVEELARTGDGAVAVRNAFGNVDLDALQRSLRGWID